MSPSVPRLSLNLTVVKGRLLCLTFNRNKIGALSRCQPWHTLEVLSFQELNVPATTWAHTDTVKVPRTPSAKINKPRCPKSGVHFLCYTGQSFI